MGANKKIVFFVVISFSLGSTVHSKDIIAELMQGTVATVADAARLLYYSFNPFTNNASNGKKNIKNREKLNSQVQKLLSSNVSQQELSRFLKKRGIEIVVSNQAITRAQFAKTIMRRFELDKSFMTSVLGWESLYYSDAQQLGIFPSNRDGAENISTKSLLKAFLVAEMLSRN